ncbi:phosphoethanolamine transferase [uncultured Polaribacter sp.]|uniref:phosphoethanolamine transferase n=1 Tax=uncultured Polaribacter sp. TaxID=174711 RepID=UPI00261E9454|nr:phosphoethanolamine transferase [uncultured Polaribacter sp.]
MKIFKTYKHEIRFHLLINLCIAVFISIASYIHIPLGTAKAYFIYVGHFFILQFTFFGFIYFLSLFKRAFSILFPIFFVLFSGFSFWEYSQNISVNTGLIQAILETKPDIAVDIMNVPFITYLLASLLTAIFCIKKFHTLENNTLKSPLSILAVIAIGCFFVIENKRSDTLKRRIPYSVVFGFQKYLQKPNLRLKEVKENVISNENGLEIILVLGESLRADHLYLNGYHRNTTPLLSQQKNLISFKNLYTPLTYTSTSVPQLLTDKSISDTNEKALTSLYSILKKANFHTKWVGNQSLEKSYKSIVNTNDSVIIIDKFHSAFSFKKEKDISLLKHYQPNKPFIKNSITTFHMIGSHWYYNSRYGDAFKKYTPIVASKHLGSSSTAQLINSYDNTIVYFDFFLNSLINNIKKENKNTLLIYVSDHGETLGEEGKWFHGIAHKTSQNPAMLIWYSDHFGIKNELKIKRLQAIENDSISSNFLFHSILDIAKIEGFKYQTKESIFSRSAEIE